MIPWFRRRIFLSYASENHQIAEEVASRLTAAGHKVFFDRSSLVGGRDYDNSIRTQIEKADLFLILLTPEALKPGRYTLTEIEIAKQVSPNPVGRVLPVMIEEIDWTELGSYLRSVTLERPSGDIPAEIVAAVQKGASRSWSNASIALLSIGSLCLGAAVTLGAQMLMLGSRPTAKNLVVTNVSAITEAPKAGGREWIVVDFSPRHAGRKEGFGKRISIRNISVVLFDSKFRVLTSGETGKPFTITESHYSLIQLGTRFRELSQPPSFVSVCADMSVFGTSEYKASGGLWKVEHWELYKLVHDEVRLEIGDAEKSEIMAAAEITGCEYEPTSN